ncbi:hypothetical protein AVDCRST_MAG92-450, partial [uncultured Coleofasciculus sp.]
GLSVLPFAGRASVNCAVGNCFQHSGGGCYSVYRSSSTLLCAKFSDFRGESL